MSETITLTPEQTNLERSRRISNGHLLERGADLVFDNKNPYPEGRIEPNTELQEKLQEEHEAETRKDFIENTKEGQLLKSHLHNIKRIEHIIDGMLHGKIDLSGLEAQRTLEDFSGFLDRNDIDVDFDTALSDSNYAEKAQETLKVYRHRLKGTIDRMLERPDIRLDSKVNVRLTPRKGMGETEGRLVENWSIIGIDAKGLLLITGDHPDLGHANKNVSIDKIIRENPQL